MSSSSSAAPYGEWNSASAPFAIRYSRSLLQKIDFFVGDAYRRIPHGGLEVGGLLYGSMADGALMLVAYQPIECEHSQGPGFVLSEGDLEGLRKQMSEPFREDGTDLPIAGWFISHCRSELALTPREAELFPELFPEAHAVTLLVKPEKFKATQYGFVVRSAAGTLDETRCQNPFLLPLATRPEGLGAESAGGGARSRSSRRLSRRGLIATANETTGTPDTLARARETKDAENASSHGEEDKEAATLPEQPTLFPENAASAPVSPATQEASRLQGREAGVDCAPPAEPSRVEAAGAAKPDAVREEEHEELDEIEPPTFGVRDEGPRRFNVPLRMQTALAAALVAVCAFGAVWTYLNFLQGPIPVTEEMNGGRPVVKWPAEATAGADGAWMNIWVDGEASSRTLTPLEQERGEATLEKDGADVIVQLQVPHWLYERSGLVRMIRVPPARPIAPAPQAVKRREFMGGAASRPGPQ